MAEPVEPVPDAPVQDAAGAGSAGAGTAKSIILFSDGTGNSSAKLFKTNVWRLYEAVDLGPSPSGKRDQIAYYDNGVGTSSFRPVRLLGGIFGHGLRRNVLTIYRYACRNYAAAPGQGPGRNPRALGDRIYGFGFSRGAFTMRVVIAMIASEGLVRADTEGELIRKSRQAYKAFRGDEYPRYWRMLGAGLRRLFGLGKPPPGRLPRGYDRSRNFQPVIRFIGVWDTVAAYGGPIAEITRAIDNWVYPLSMPNYELHPRVERARHALAIDDQRDSFQPLLWDEVQEAALVEAARAARSQLLGLLRESLRAGPDATDDVKEIRSLLSTCPGWLDDSRLQQVWFTGMHADVGGGYPDESLSYISLLWMIEEARKAGLRTLDVITDRYIALANSAGPIHDSRAGLAAFYRYQPRKIAAWLAPEDASTLSLRDPLISDRTGRPRGLLSSVRVHESVLARIANGTDGYAPINLPRRYEIVPPKLAENLPQPTSGGAGRPGAAAPLIGPELRDRLENESLRTRVSACIETLWDSVWKRRLSYFISAFTVTGLLLIGLGWLEPPETPFLSDGRNWLGSLIGLLGLALPEFADGIVARFQNNSLYVLIAAAILIVLWRWSGGLERGLRDGARRIWIAATDTKLPVDTIAPPDPSWLQRARNSRLYQRSVQILKWHVLPNLVGLGLILVLLLSVWLLFAVYTQLRLPRLETGEAMCRSGPAEPLQPGRARSFDFSTRELCNSTGVLIEKGKHYTFLVELVDPWFDGSLPATPRGLSAADLPFPNGYLGVPVRRVVTAGYLKPMIEIRPGRSDRGLFHNVYIYPLDLSAEGEGVTLHRGELHARRSGALHLFANDAVLPFASEAMGKYDVSYFYTQTGTPPGNRGTACVTVFLSGRRDERIPVEVKTPICRRAAAERARAEELRQRAEQANEQRRAVYLIR